MIKRGIYDKSDINDQKLYQWSKVVLIKKSCINEQNLY